MSIMFLCGQDDLGNPIGEAICHDDEVEARVHEMWKDFCVARERENLRKTGKRGQFPTHEEQEDFIAQAYETLERREELRAITAAVDLLTKHGYVIEEPPPTYSPRPIFSETPDGQ